MKKICILTTISGTMKSFVVPTAEYLHRECGYDVTLICHPDEAFAASLPEGIKYIPVSMGRGIDFKALGSIRELKKIFKREKFDMVQYSTPNAACYASIAAKGCRIPIRLYCQWGIRYVGLSGVSRIIFKFIEKLVCRNSTHIRAVSRKNMAFAVSEGLYTEDKAKVVGNGGTIGVDMNYYKPENKGKWRADVRSKYGIGGDEFVLGFVGRISTDKGCGELLSAFRSLCDERGDCRLMLIGSAEDDGRIPAELIEWSRASDRVISAGRIAKEEMQEYYSALDILVHPTYREGFGMVIQEAGALGIPVIT
ncbi:MAG: glycosyltransferase, partial [Clostridia bacterium]|nr:glycosyltransferase [Clostridia bacterium]